MWPIEAKPLVSSFCCYEDEMPPILETFCMVPSKLLLDYDERATSCISDIPLASILPTALEALMSKIRIFLSVPTLIAKDPSAAILIELMSPL